MLNSETLGDEGDTEGAEDSSTTEGAEHSNEGSADESPTTVHSLK